MKVKSLFLYPIKSCQGISLEQAQVTAKGLTDINNPQIYDRQFMLVNSKGKFLTQREFPQMATIAIKLENNCLSLHSNNGDLAPFKLIPDDRKNNLKVQVWSSKTIAIDQGDEVAQWLQRALKIDTVCRLVKQSDQHIRAIDPFYSKKLKQPVSFADGFPFLLANTASLDDLNQRLAQKYGDETPHIEMINFRPNIVVETPTAFIEDSWKKIQIGSNEFSVVKPCTRCIVTTTNQETGVRNALTEPLLTLSEYRKKRAGIMFGQNMIPLTSKIVKIGDYLTIKK